MDPQPRTRSWSFLKHTDPGRSSSSATSWIKIIPRSSPRRLLHKNPRQSDFRHWTGQVPGPRSFFLVFLYLLSRCARAPFCTRTNNQLITILCGHFYSGRGLPQSPGNSSSRNPVVRPRWSLQRAALLHIIIPSSSRIICQC